MSDWSDAVTAANKILGKDGKLPKPRVDPASMYPILSKGWEGLNASREELQKKLLDLQNAFTQSKNTFKQYGDIVDGEDFGLNENDPDDKKRISDVSGIILKALKSMEDQCDARVAELAKLDQILTNLKRLKDLKI